MEDEFAKKRLEGIIENNHRIKVEKNYNKKCFVEEYIKSKGELTEDLIEYARLYTLLEKSVIPQDHNKNYFPIQITKEVIDEIYKKIVLNAKENYIYFYESWRRKIDKKFTQTFIDSAFNDLKNALITYRKCSNPNLNCSYDQVDEGELKNLYLLLKSTNLDVGEINIKNICKEGQERE